MRETGFDPSVELNPISRSLMSHGFAGFVLINLGISLILSSLVWVRVIRVVLIAMTVISVLIALFNLSIFLLCQ